MKQRFNLLQFIAEHLTSDNHRPAHRLTMGAIIMIVGTCVATIPFAFYHCEIVLTAAGGALHAVGAIPWIDILILRK